MSRDAVPGERLSDSSAMVRQLESQSDGDRPRRRFRTVGVFDGDPDPGRHAKGIVRQELGGGCCPRPGF